MKYTTKNITYMGILSALTIALSTMDNAITVYLPISIPLGIKVGFASVPIMYTIFTNSYKVPLILTILKGLFSGFRGFTAMCNSLCGGLLSLAIMLLLYKKTKLSYSSISVFGGIFNNVGQLISAIVILQSPNIAVFYLPIMVLCGSISGLVMGMVVSNVKKKL